MDGHLEKKEKNKVNTQSDPNGLWQHVRSRLELTVCLWTACFQMSCENSARRSGPQTPPELGEMKLSAGGIWCLIKTPTKKASGRCFDLVSLWTENLRLALHSITFSGNECGFALVTGSSRVHSFDVKQVVLTRLQENLLLAAFDARDGAAMHQWES